MEQSMPPWNKDQIKNLNSWQTCGFFHPFTCGNEKCRADLIATENGWKCPNCDYTQNWAHGFMTRNEPKKMNFTL